MCVRAPILKFRCPFGVVGWVGRRAIAQTQSAGGAAGMCVAIWSRPRWLHTHKQVVVEPRAALGNLLGSPASCYCCAAIAHADRDDGHNDEISRVMVATLEEPPPSLAQK